jgi:hypothetical protein
MFGNNGRFYRDNTSQFDTTGTHIITDSWMHSTGSEGLLVGYMDVYDVYGWEDSMYVFATIENIGTISPTTYNDKKISGAFYAKSLSWDYTGQLQIPDEYVVILAGDHPKNAFSSITFFIDGRQITFPSSSAMWNSPSGNDNSSQNHYFAYAYTSLTYWAFTSNVPMIDPAKQFNHDNFSISLT